MNKRRVVSFVGASLASLLLVLGYATWERGAPPGCRPPVHEVPIEQLSLEHRGVRVSGTAHYPVRIQINSGDRGGGKVFAFPLFPRGDTTAREIRVLVYSPVAPDPLLGFEDRTVEGLVRPPGSKVPEQLRDTLKMYGYSFADDYVVLELFGEGD